MKKISIRHLVLASTFVLALYSGAAGACVLNIKNETGLPIQKINLSTVGGAAGYSFRDQILPNGQSLANQFAQWSCDDIFRWQGYVVANDTVYTVVGSWSDSSCPIVKASSYNIRFTSPRGMLVSNPTRPGQECAIRIIAPANDTNWPK